jgi:beta-lactamase class D
MSADAVAEDAQLARLFAQAGVDGTLVLESIDNGRRYLHNDARSLRPFIAASTFKILNTLIAVEEGVIAGADAPIPWDGTRYDIAAWNRDQTLRSAFQVSCVWCYQALARRVGADAYRAWIDRVGYGALQEPFDLDRFWLDGALTISAADQVAFLGQVTRRSLGFSPATYQTLAAVMRSDAAPGVELYAKTGWSTRGTPGLGWYVGYLETPKATWVFALNMDTSDAEDLPLRKQLVMDALRVKGLLPAAFGGSPSDRSQGLEPTR